MAINYMAQDNISYNGTLFFRWVSGTKLWDNLPAQVSIPKSCVSVVALSCQK